MQRTLKKFVLLLMLVCAVVCCAVFAACTEPDDQEQKVTYSVTVTTDDESLALTSLKAQWLSGTEVKGEKTLDADGRASMELVEGEYTVTLDGVSATTHTFNAANVTAENPNATIAITKISTSEPVMATYTVTVTLGEEVELDLTTVTAQWKKGTTLAGSQVLSAEGAASIELEEGAYTVTLVGVPEAYEFTDATVTADNCAATIAITEKNTDVPPVATYIVTLTVVVPEGVELSGAQVQKYNGEEAYGEPEAVNVGANMVMVPAGGYSVSIINLPDYLACNEKITVSGDDEFFAATINVVYAEIEYTVNVSADEGLSLEGASAALYADGTEVAYAEIIDGVATITATAGSYTVELKNHNSEYEYAPATVTIANRSAEISVTATKYTIKLDCEAANIEITDLTALTVKLVAGDYVRSASFNADGVATVIAAANEYSIEIEGLASTYKFVNAPLTADNRDTVVYVAENVSGTSYMYQEATGSWSGTNVSGSDFTIDHEGRFYLASMVDSQGRLVAPRISLKAYGDDMHTYNIRWDADLYNVSYYDVYNDGHTANSTGYVQYVMNKSESVRFVLQVQYLDTLTVGDTFPFVVTVECGEAPAKGSELNPYYIASLDDMMGEHAADEGVTDAYFVLPLHGHSTSYAIEFAEGLSVYFLEYGRGTYESPIINGGYFTPSDDAINGVRGWLHIVATDNTPIAFTLGEYVPPAGPGEAAHTAIEIVAGEETGRFEGALYESTLWYSFTPETTDNYKIYAVKKSAFISVTLYKDYNEETDEMTEVGTESSASAPSTSFELTAGEKYLLKFEIDYGYEATFRINTPEEEPVGSQSNPMEVTGIGAELNTVTIMSNGSNTYFKFVVTEESLKDGKFIFTWDQKYSSLYGYFYKDANYSTYLSGSSSNSTYYGSDYPECMQFSVEVGDTVYFKINSYGLTSVSFTINPVEAEDETLKLSVETPVTVDLKGAKYWDFEETFQLDNVPAGKYKLTMTSDSTVTQNAPLTIKFGEVELTTRSFTYTSEAFEIAEGVSEMTISTSSWAATGAVTVTFTLSEVAGGTEPDGLTVGGTYKLTISQGAYMSSATLPLANVPAGTYTLKLGNAINAVTYIQPAGGKSVTLNAGETEIEIEIPDNCTAISLSISYGGVSGSLTVDFALEGEAVAAGLTVGGSYELTIPQGPYFSSADLPLSNVPAGTYTLKLGSAVGADCYVTPAGGKQLMLAQGGTEIEIEIPENCESIAFLVGYGGVSGSLTIEFTLIGEEPAPEGLTVGGSYELTVPQGPYFSSASLPLVNVPAGTYILKLGSAVGADCYVTPAGGKQLMLAQGGTEIEIEIPENCESIAFLVGYGGVSGSLTVNFTLVAAGSGEETHEPVEGQYEKVLVYFNALEGTHTSDKQNTMFQATAEGEEEESVTYTITFEEGLIVIVYTEGYTWYPSWGEKITVNSGDEVTLNTYTSIYVYAPEGMECKITLTGEGSGDDDKFVVGEEYTVEIPVSENWVNIPINLEAGNYTITISGDTDSVKIRDTSDKLGVGGDILENATTGEFTVTAAGEYNLRFLDMTFSGAGKNFTVLIAAKVEDEVPTEYTVAEALDIAKALGSDAYSEAEVYVKGYVVATGTWNSQYSNYTNVYIAATPYEDKTTALQVYRLIGDNFTTGEEIELGAYIVIYGYLQNYKGNTPEMTYNGSSTPTAVEYVAATDEVKVNLALADVDNTLEVYQEGETTLPATKISGVTLAWAVKEGDAATVTANGLALNVEALPEEDATVVLELTVSCGEASQTKEVTVTIKAIVDNTGYIIPEFDLTTYATNNSWDSNSQNKTIQVDDNITITVTASDSNSGKWYSDNWRIYQAGDPQITFTAESGYVLVSIKITYTSANAGVLTNEDKTTQYSSGTLVDNINASSFTFGVGNTSNTTRGQARITAIEVVYKAA